MEGELFGMGKRQEGNCSDRKKDGGELSRVAYMTGEEFSGRGIVREGNFRGEELSGILLLYSEHHVRYIFISMK